MAMHTGTGTPGANATGAGPRRFRATAVAALLAIGTLGASLAGCGGDPRSIADFCNRLRKEGAALTDPSDPARLAELYAKLDQHAPLQIKDAWHEVTLLVARATTFNPKDAADTQALLAESLRAKSSIDAVASWADTKCKVPLGRMLAPDDTIPDNSTPDDSTPDDGSAGS